jgi:hypothetical protein
LPSASDHDVSVYPTDSWYETEYQADNQGYRDGSTVSTSWHFNEASDWAKQLVAYGFVQWPKYAADHAARVDDDRAACMAECN